MKGPYKDSSSEANSAAQSLAEENCREQLLLTNSRAAKVPTGTLQRHSGLHAVTCKPANTYLNAELTTESKALKTSEWKSNFNINMLLQ